MIAVVARWGSDGRVSRADGFPADRTMIVAWRLDDPANPSAGGTPVAAVFTDATGDYALYVEPGIYALAAHRAWWSPAAVWWDGRPDEASSDLVVVEAGQRGSGIDFVLP